MQDLKALEGKTLAELREIAKAVGIGNVMDKKAPTDRNDRRDPADTPSAEPAQTAPETAAAPETPAAETAAKSKRGRRPRLAKSEKAAGEPEPNARRSMRKSDGRTAGGGKGTDGGEKGREIG